MRNIQKYFGSNFDDRGFRRASYNYLEDFLGNSHVNWNISPNTTKIVTQLIQELAKKSDQEIAFLVCHMGFIPEWYEHDSSQETLYTKLIETVVLVWAKRLGFSDSVLPSQKSSKEDVTLRKGNTIIVCDAKSYRLGRSQKAPNVKDALKLADIQKWLSAYPSTDSVGGLVTFPSQFDWQNGSDFYQYTTDYRTPTAVLFYQQMAFMILAGFKFDKIVSWLKSYRTTFPRPLPKSENNRAMYFHALEKFLFHDRISDWAEFKVLSQEIIKECVFNTLEKIEKYLSAQRQGIKYEVDKMKDIHMLREELVEYRFLHKHERVVKQLECIKNFRDYTKPL